MAVLFFYECALTIKDEMRLFWKKKLTGATVLFWLNKWFIITTYAINTVTYFKISDPVCPLLLSLVARLDRVQRYDHDFGSFAEVCCASHCSR